MIKSKQILKRIISLILLSTLLITLFACSRKSQDQDVKLDIEVALIGTHFEEYSYQRVRVDVADTVHAVQGAVLYEDRIYTAYATMEPTIVLTSFRADGSDVRSIEMQSPGNQIAGFNITNEGNFAFFVFHVTMELQSMRQSAFYVEYDVNGTELKLLEFGEFTLINNPLPNTFTVLNDGRVLTLDVNSNLLHELDFDKRDWGEAFSIVAEGRNFRGIFPVQASSPYDLLLSDGTNLYGYSIEKNEQTTILNWMQAGYANIGFTQAGMFNDGRIFTVMSEIDSRGEWNVELYILTPVQRSAKPDKIILTLGGVTVLPDLVQAVALFNSRNSMYQIEIYEYVDQEELQASSDMQAYWNNALQRFQIDIMTGRIPDIFVQPPPEISDRGFLIDLYPLIDADPDINRTDFFPHILASMERPDGTLQSVYNTFSTETLVSHSKALGHIDAWTPVEMFKLIQDTQDMIVPFGADLTRDVLLDRILFLSNMGFIDLDNYSANFDSEEFIEMLEIAKLLPTISDLPNYIRQYDIANDIRQHDIANEIMRIQRGEQLLSRGVIGGINQYQAYFESIEDCIFLGYPRFDGGVNTFLFPLQDIGIGVNTEHIDIAWGFVREFLLPTVSASKDPHNLSLGFPIRIDMFEKQIKEAMNPNPTMHPNTGEIIEDLRHYFYNYSTAPYLIELGQLMEVILLYAMTEETAKNLRLFIDSVEPVRRGISMELWHAISGDLNDFYSGVRSAEATARIIQNRAEIWLSEQQLLARR